MDIIPILLKVTVLFLIIAVGYIANRCGVLNTEGSRMLSRLVICVTFPAYVLGGAMTSATPSAESVLLLGGLALGHYLLLFLLAWLLPKLLHTPESQIGTYRFMMVFANVGFIGYPVVSAVLGPEAVFPATMFVLPFNLLCYTVGVLMIANGSGARLSLRLLLTPSVIACATAIVLALLPLDYPSLIVDACQTLGSVTTPAALLIIGSSLADIPLRQLSGSPRLYLLCLFRLVLMPLLCWAVLRNFISDRIALGVTVLLSGMPVATNGTMFCLTYGGDRRLISQGTFLTTLLSLATIPLMALLLQI